MRTSLMLICFFILAWQGLVITNTLKTRLENRTNQVQTLLNQIQPKTNKRYIIKYTFIQFYSIKLMKKKYLTSQEYNSLVVTVQKSANYITDKEKKMFDLIFEKLFVITEDDIISNEEINHPISNPN